MRTVSKEEALACLENMKKWLTKSNTSAREGSIGEWIFKGENRSANKFEQIYTESLTPTAIQESWKIPNPSWKIYAILHHRICIYRLVSPPIPNN